MRAKYPARHTDKEQDRRDAARTILITFTSRGVAMKQLLITSVCMSLACAAWGAQTVYVQSMQAKILASPDFKAATVARVKRGAALPLEQQTDDWVKVRYAGTTGWVPRLLVSDTAPLDEVSLIDGGDHAISHDVRRRPSAVTTGGAARGLAEDGRSRPSNELTQNYSAVKKMESLEIDDGTVLTFLQAGVKQ